jgi:hypothetical protein
VRSGRQSNAAQNTVDASDGDVDPIDRGVPAGRPAVGKDENARAPGRDDDSVAIVEEDSLA